MNGTMRMNTFLQRMLKKSDDESVDGKMLYDGTTQQVEYSPKSQNKSNWVKKLGAYSPSKRDISPSIGISPSRPITPKPAGHRYDYYKRRSVPEPLTSEAKDTVTNVAMPDLEKIIHEFEEGFLSPTRQETKEIIKSGRFVKQIVAAFEEKFKTYNGHKMEVNKSSNESIKDDNKTIRKIETIVENEMEESTAFMGTTYVIESLESQLSQYLDSCESKSETYSRRSIESMDLVMCTFAMDEELTLSTPSRKLQDLSVQQSMSSRSIMLDETLKPESPKILDPRPLVRSNSSMKRERQPKIVGAFLKKPIEVEDTSIDWIPITGKKLPRKSSFKRLLSVLTGKKSSDKSSKLYCSQVNLQEENARELHDSGYDEKSCSSSSLTSLVSFTDLLSQQENYEIDINRRTLTTFQQTNPIDIDRNGANLKTDQQSAAFFANQCSECNNEIFADDAADTCSTYSKKLLLEEVPRSELRLSLGPGFPSGPRFADKSPVLHRNKISSSTISQEVSSDFSFEDHSYETLPQVSPLPKHPFVSSKQKFEDNLSAFEAEKQLNLNYFNKVELRRDAHSWTFPSSDNTYDVPRRYMSKSDPGITTIGSKSRREEIVYDVPKPEIPQRPRSSVYEDALSLKRRNEHFTYSAPSSIFYAFPSQEEPHYATVKPRNTRIYPSRELLRTEGGINDFKRYTTNFISSTF